MAELTEWKPFDEKFIRLDSNKLCELISAADSLLKLRPLVDLTASLRAWTTNYHQILPIIAEKVHKEKVQQEKLKAVKACLNFEETSRYSESGTPIRRRGLKERLGPRHVRSRSGSLEPRRDRPESPKKKGPNRKAVFKRLEKGVFHRLGDKGKSVSIHSDDSRRWSHHSSRRDTESCHQSSRSRAKESASERRYTKRASSRRTDELSESEGSAGGHWKSKLKRKKSSIEDDLSQPWSAAKKEQWEMPTWCHMFNSTLTGNYRVWFDDLPKEIIDIYDDLKKAFLENYLQQKKCIKDPVKIHNIRQRDGESTEEFVRGYKLKCRDVKGALECMKISGFMHGITNPELIKRLHDKIPKLVDEMMRVTTAFLRGEVAASNREDEGTEGPMIIEAEIGGHCVHRIGEIIWPIGQIQLLVKIGDEEHSTLAWMNFMVVRSSSPYNGIIGRPGVRKLQAVPSTAHGMLKILVEGGVITLKSSKLVPLECAVVSRPEGAPSATKPIMEEIIKVAINLEYLEQTVMIGSTLTEEGRNKLCGLLQRNLDIFYLEACGYDWHPKTHCGASPKRTGGMFSG
ncbi:reverse transcriptase domain-containing protein [Tanacetum coccineum]|uniref:Reverse transcriptase domain-containing protein n=1 Tax=Tanacetum coccineum TaxID=301880 RepID=A0ABQ5HN53_9ASTR